MDPEIADQVPGRREATDVSDDRDQRCGCDDVDAGDRH